MSDKNESSAFAVSIREGRFREGVAALVGQHPTGIERTRNLILELDRLDPTGMKSLRSWCDEPMPPLPIIPEHRGVLEDLAAHEFGHLVAARALGFRTGDVSLVLNSPDGSHTGTVEIFTDEGTPDMATAFDYMQRRVMVHYSGMLAQWEEPLSQSRVIHALQDEGGESDRQKARELIQVMLNIKGDVTDDGPTRAMLGLGMSANILITQNFGVIRALAARFASNIQFYGQTHKWTGAQIESQPEVASIVVPPKAQRT